MAAPKSAPVVPSDTPALAETGASPATPPKPRLVLVEPENVGPSGYVPRNREVIIWVPVPIYPGLTNLEVGINVAVAVRVVEGIDMPGDGAVEQSCRKLAFIAPYFRNWNMADPMTQKAIPVPVFSLWESYKPLASFSGGLSELGQWIQGAGINAALDIHLKNLTTASEPPSTTETE